MPTQKTKSCKSFASFYALRSFMGTALLIGAISVPAFASGADTYKAKCAGCHGPDGSGATVMGKKFKLRDLRSAEVQKQSDEDLQTVIARGKPPMPAFEKTLDAPKIVELVAFIRSIKN